MVIKIPKVSHNSVDVLHARTTEDNNAGCSINDVERLTVGWRQHQKELTTVNCQRASCYVVGALPLNVFTVLTA